MFDWLGRIFAAVFDLLRDVIARPLLDVFEWIRQSISERVLPWLVDQIPTELVDFFDDGLLTQIQSLISDVNWLFPFWTLLGIYFAAYGVCGTIRLVRWILAIIPTIGG